MNTKPKLARNVQVAEPHPAPEKKFRVNWLNLITQIAAGVALVVFVIAMIEGYSL